MNENKDVTASNIHYCEFNMVMRSKNPPYGTAPEIFRVMDGQVARDVAQRIASSYGADVESICLPNGVSVPRQPLHDDVISAKLLAATTMGGSSEFCDVARAQLKNEHNLPSVRAMVSRHVQDFETDMLSNSENATQIIAEFNRRTISFLEQYGFSALSLSPGKTQLQDDTLNLDASL